MELRVTPRVEIDAHAKQKIHRLMAMMLVTPNAVKLMGKHQINYKVLPRPEMDMERRFLRIFYALSGDHDPAVQDQKGDVVITADEMRYSLGLEVEQARADKFIDTIKVQIPIDGKIPNMAASLAEWLKNREAAATCEAMRQQFDVRIGTYDEQYLRAQTLWQNAAPNAKNFTGTLGGDTFDQWDVVYSKRLDAARQGRTLGPTLPWGLRHKVAMLKKGELCTIAAKSSMGKSTLALQLAHNIAHEQKGYDVAYFYMETRTESQLDRLVSSAIMVTVQDLQDPTRGFNLFEDEIAFKAYQDYRKNYLGKQETNGRVWFIHCPGLTALEFDSMVTMYKAYAQAKGRELAVIVDYYSLLADKGLVSRNQPGWEKNDTKANFFKEQAERHEIYLITFAQDNMEANYKDHARKTTARGSLIYERSQVVIRLLREYADDTLPFEDNGPSNARQQKLDAARRPIFWHQVGQPRSFATLQVEKASDGATGPVNIRILGSYFQIFGEKRD